MESVASRTLLCAHFCAHDFVCTGILSAALLASRTRACALHTSTRVQSTLDAHAARACAPRRALTDHGFDARGRHQTTREMTTSEMTMRETSKTCEKKYQTRGCACGPESGIATAGEHVDKMSGCAWRRSVYTTIATRPRGVPPLPARACPLAARPHLARRLAPRRRLLQWCSRS